MTSRVTMEALIVAHGQPSNPQPPEDHLALLAKSVQKQLPGWKIRSATVAAAGRLEAELVQMSANALVYPMFMSDGWFVSRVLPSRIKEAPIKMLPPLGFDPDLPTLASQIIQNIIDQKGWQTNNTRLLLAAHGSERGDRAAKAAYRFADMLHTQLKVLELKVGFIEEAPFLKDKGIDLGKRSICLPFFALEGDHFRNDIPQALKMAHFRGLQLPPLGEDKGIVELIAKAIERAS